MKNSLTNYIMSKNNTIKSVIQRLNSSGLQIVFLSESTGKIIGTVTDGDIRRIYLKNISVDEKAINIANTNFKYVYDNASAGEILFLMKRCHIRHIPVLNSKFKLIKVVTYNEMFDQMIEDPIIIFAGGKGERLRPYTKTTPKPLLNIGEKSIIENIIERFATLGFFNIHISLNYKSNMIKNRIMKNFPNMFSDHAFIVEKKPLGTAGSLSRMKDHTNGLVITHNGDILSDVNFRKLLEEHKKKHNDITCVVIPYESQIPFGTVEITKSRILKISEKPVHKHFILAGINVVSTEIIGNLKNEQRLNMDKLFDNAIKEKRRVGFYLHSGFWMDIGDKDAFLKAKDMFGGIK